MKNWLCNILVPNFGFHCNKKIVNAKLYFICINFSTGLNRMHKKVTHFTSKLLPFTTFKCLHIAQMLKQNIFFSLVAFKKIITFVLVEFFFSICSIVLLAILFYRKCHHRLYLSWGWEDILCVRHNELEWSPSLR